VNFTHIESQVAASTLGLFRPDTVSWFLRDFQHPRRTNHDAVRLRVADIVCVRRRLGWQRHHHGRVVDADTVNNVLVWSLRNSNTPGAPDITPFAYGGVGAIPVVGDWDGDGITYPRRGRVRRDQQRPDLETAQQ